MKLGNHVSFMVGHFFLQIYSGFLSKVIMHTCDQKYMATDKLLKAIKST